MSTTWSADETTRTKAADCVRALLEGDPRATLVDWIDVAVGAFADSIGLDVELPLPSLVTGERRGRPGDLLAAVSRPELRVLPRTTTQLAIARLSAAACCSPGAVYRQGVAALWAEVCGPDADAWEHTRRAEAAGCAAVA